MLYQYNCQEHGNFDLLQSMNEPHNATCPKCRKPAKRIFSPPELTGSLPTRNRKKFESYVDNMKDKLV